MKNFEKNFDRLLNNLKKAKEILKECNLEMQKALGETKSIKFVIQHKGSEKFYNDRVDMWFNDIECASIYKTAERALEIYKTSFQGTRYNIEDVEIVQVQLKVVE